ncbi:MAG: hypothetical protein LIO77_05920 [Rikenellaceae bacterium]|nr:hypothetical protein [Rikenellaceae bacterium]
MNNTHDHHHHVCKFYNRELSWLQFNERVLQEAQDVNNPLMQRLRFLGIFSNNQDEFIKVRVANILRMEKSKRKKDRELTGGVYSLGAADQDQS